LLTHGALKRQVGSYQTDLGLDTLERGHVRDSAAFTLPIRRGGEAAGRPGRGEGRPRLGSAVKKAAGHHSYADHPGRRVVRVAAQMITERPKAESSAGDRER
jgi:hypothetical protein